MCGISEIRPSRGGFLVRRRLPQLDIHSKKFTFRALVNLASSMDKMYCEIEVRIIKEFNDVVAVGM